MYSQAVMSIPITRNLISSAIRSHKPLHPILEKTAGGVGSSYPSHLHHYTIPFPCSLPKTCFVSFVLLCVDNITGNDILPTKRVPRIPYCECSLKIRCCVVLLRGYNPICPPWCSVTVTGSKLTTVEIRFVNDIDIYRCYYKGRFYHLKPHKADRGLTSHPCRQPNNTWKLLPWLCHKYLMQVSFYLSIRKIFR